MTIGNMRGARKDVDRSQTGGLNTREDLGLGKAQATTMAMTTKVLICLVQQSNRDETKKGDSKKKPALLKKIDNCSTLKVKEAM